MFDVPHPNWMSWGSVMEHMFDMQKGLSSISRSKDQEPVMTKISDGDLQDLVTGVRQVLAAAPVEFQFMV